VSLATYRSASNHPPGVFNKVLLLEESYKVCGEATAKPVSERKTKQSSLGPKLVLQSNATVSKNDFVSAD
jgi:hypothetical protein